MDKITNFIEMKLAPPLIRVSQIRYLQAIQKTFMTLMPILIFSSILILVAAFPIPGWDKIVAPITGMLWGGVNTTLGLLALLAALGNGYYLGLHYKDKGIDLNPFTTAILAFIGFMMFFPKTVTEAGLTVVNAQYFDSAGLFASIVISIVVVEIYRLIIQTKFTIKMPEGVPPMVTQSFTALIPASAAMLVAWFASFVIGIDIPSLISALFEPLVTAGKGPIPQFLSFFLDRLLWFTGIHGSSLVESVMSPIWNVMIAENIDAYMSGSSVIPNLFTAEWTNYFIRISVLPIAFIALRSKAARYKALGKVSVTAAIFNIAEPVMFGLPIVLNPILFIPWVFGFSALWIWTYVFTAIIPILPPIITQVAWTVPAPISAYLATGGSVVAFLFSCANYVILGLIFYPFFKVLEKQELESEAANELENSTL